MTGGLIIINRIFLTALVGAMIAGLLLGVMQHFTVVPLVLQAETYEQSTAPAHEHQKNHDHAGGAEHEPWAPADGVERTLFTFLNTVISSIGFALLLVACYAMQKTINWRLGVVWGLGGFISFHLAPALGLPPELPGATAAALEARQGWWFLTVVFTAGGLLTIAFISGQFKWLGIVLIGFPHLLGAPQPDSHVGLAPAELERTFVVTSLITNAVFWVVLGAVTASIYARFERYSKQPRRDPNIRAGNSEEIES